MTDLAKKFIMRIPLGNSKKEQEVVRIGTGVNHSKLDRLIRALEEKEELSKEQ